MKLPIAALLIIATGVECAFGLYAPAIAGFAFPAAFLCACGALVLALAHILLDTEQAIHELGEQHE